MMNELSEKILKLKKEKNAIILAHLYQIPEVQEIADYVGDSYYLSQVARDAKEDLIIFCGVKFMAESAKVLSPDKTVILPAPNAGCPMADMAEVEDVVGIGTTVTGIKDLARSFKEAQSALEVENSLMSMNICGCANYPTKR